MIYGRVYAVNSPRQGLGLSHLQLRKIPCAKYKLWCQRVKILNAHFQSLNGVVITNAGKWITKVKNVYWFSTLK